MLFREDFGELFFPCQLSAFSKKDTPLPFIVFAITIVGGWWLVVSSWWKTFWISSKLLPSFITTVFHPNDSTRFLYVSTSHPSCVSPRWPRRLTSSIPIRFLVCSVLQSAALHILSFSKFGVTRRTYTLGGWWLVVSNWWTAFSFKPML